MCARSAIWDASVLVEAETVFGSPRYAMRVSPLPDWIAVEQSASATDGETSIDDGADADEVEGSDPPDEPTTSTTANEGAGDSSG